MASSFLDFERPIRELEALLDELRKPEKQAEARQQGIDLDAEIARLEAELRKAIEQVFARLTPWEQTLLSRHQERPYTFDYVRVMFDDFLELSGDRLADNDEAIVGGPAFLRGRPIMVIGHQKGRDLRERQRRNFGSARAEGYRKALRLARLAEKFDRPIISFVDTAAAAADLRAEEHGISEAIARNMAEFSALRVPIIAVVIGEGGSGGAIGVAVGDRVLMLEHAIYSVIPPEGCAAILWRDKSRAEEAAAALKLTAQDALELGVIEEVVPEPLGGAHRDLAVMASTLSDAILRHLREVEALSPDERLEERYRRFRRMGRWTVAPPASPPSMESEP